MLLPARPITREIAFSGTETFFTPDSVVVTGGAEDFLTTSFQPSSRFPACFGLVWVPDLELGFCIISS